MFHRKQNIIVLLALFLFVGCPPKDHFLTPYFSEVLGCFEEDDPFLEEAAKYRFELSSDAALFADQDKLIIPHVVFAEDSRNLCSSVQVEESWWNALLDEAVYTDLGPDDPSKQHAAKVLFTICYASYLLDGKPLDDSISPEEALRVIGEFNKLVKRCGADILPFDVMYVDNLDELFS